MTDEDIFVQALFKYGTRAELLKAIEELAELQRALVRYILDLKFETDPLPVYEEMADVGIMLDQIMVILSSERDHAPLAIAEIRKAKMKRLEEYLAETPQAGKA